MPTQECDCRLPGVDTVVLCSDTWGQCTHYPAAGNVSSWQRTAASLTASLTALGHRELFHLRLHPLLGTAHSDRLMQRYEGLVPWLRFGTTLRGHLSSRTPHRIRWGSSYNHMVSERLLLPTSASSLPSWCTSQEHSQKSCTQLSSSVCFQGNPSLPQELCTYTEPAPKFVSVMIEEWGDRIQMEAVSGSSKIKKKTNQW